VCVAEISNTRISKTHKSATHAPSSLIRVFLRVCCWNQCVLQHTIQQNTSWFVCFADSCVAGFSSCFADSCCFSCVWHADFCKKMYRSFLYITYTQTYMCEKNESSFFFNRVGLINPLLVFGWFNNILILCHCPRSICQWDRPNFWKVSSPVNLRCKMTTELTLENCADTVCYGVATISRLLKMIVLFCRI